MAVLATNANTITGSATNTLGTLGRSIFNSTVGTFADKDTMDQLYGAMNKLVSSIETVDKNIDYEAFKGRNKADDLFALLAGLDIKSSYDFMNKNREFMKRLMRLNKQEKDITLDALGVDATGESDVIKNEYVRDYDHVKGNNYLEDYVKTLPQNQQVGDETTTLQLESSTNFNYAGLHNDLYVVNQNLYPDDENRGTFANKWIVENRNSLLYKTKKLFNSRKVNTIISRFHTDPHKRPSLLDNAKSKYGLSHGRNLLTYQAENGLNSAYANGYDNPYCRVWTHHHQYDRLYKTIRPFSEVDDQGNYMGTLSVQDFHKWEQFSDSKDTNKETNGEWGWKKESNNGWQYSVLQDNGLVNITPKYDGGGAKNIHTKQCMFSIENLAWRGYDPYSFEKALSWEQRGPLGGRIMWFPPYGIQFNETTSTQWINNSFLGRGEDVYTYANTTRTGTLSFMLVVDHPSILDYVAWTNENKNVNDTDILRFLAGCGEGDGNGLRRFAKPTPLTDEYTQIHHNAEANEVEEEETVVVEEPIPTPEEEKPIDKVLCFYVFYPNNYSGTYDDPDGELRNKYNDQTEVEPIPYLLAGTGAQKEDGDYKRGFQNDKPIKDDNSSTWIGNGYEMGSGLGLGTGGGYISGTSKYPNSKGSNGRRYWTGLNGDGRQKAYTTGLSDPSKCKKWYYRIDGRYKFPQDSALEEKSHYYNQTLPTASSYKDEKSFGLNKNIDVLVGAMSDQIVKGELDETEQAEGNVTIYNLKGNVESEVYTLAEVACALYDGDSTKTSKCCVSGERVDRIKKMLASDKIKEIKSITATGHASAHGYVETNQKLGEHRAQTAANWFLRNIQKFVKVNLTPTTTYESADGNNLGSGDKVIGDWTTGDEGAKNAKKWRYARVEIAFTTTGLSTPATANDTVRTETEEGTDEPKDNKTYVTKKVGGKYYVGYDPTGEEGYYKGKKYPIYLHRDTKKKWFKVSEGDGKSAKFISVDYAAEYEVEPIQRFGNGKGDENRLRYDQEYHFFKVLKQTDPVVYGSLMDKLQYFDPAFHSMTPEGFNGRLTFLQQCMRQGNTVSASDGKFAKSANNLAFGRAPYCVLRLGDFYNQMIVIDNLSINYDPLVWDLNVEGIGVQPLIAHVQISFKFVGGGDLTGPVRRLQNAMSFNYYANARLYDNRADRIERKWSDKTCGAIEHDEILDDDIYNASNEEKAAYNMTNKKDGSGKTKTSSFYTTQMYK